MKYNKRQTDIISTILLIFIILAGVAITYQAVNQDLKPKFVITQENCWNETTTESYNFPDDYHSVSCPTKTDVVPCYDKNGNVIIGVKCNQTIVLGNADFCYEIPGFIVTQKSEGYTTYVYFWQNWTQSPQYFGLLVHSPGGGEVSQNVPIKSTHIEPKCNQTEVDEIKIPGNKREAIGENGEITHPLWAYILCSNIWGAGEEGLEALANEGLSCEIFSNSSGNYSVLMEITPDKIISKKDLTESWLNENCKCSKEECGSICVPYWHTNPEGFDKPKVMGCERMTSTWNVYKDCPVLCKSWKCGDYFVEAKR